MRRLRTRGAAAAFLPLILTAVAGCDIVTADFKAQESAEWRRSYEFQPGGRLEISNVNGKIEVSPAADNKVEIVATKLAKAATAEAAREALRRIEILESVTSGSVTLETRLPRGGGFLNPGGEVRYVVRVPSSADVRFVAVNGPVDLSGLAGRITAETTNGAIHARDISGPIEASTTNGGVEVELARLAEPGVKLESTNGGIALWLPADARGTISASVTNGSISAERLSLEPTESTRRRLEARLNGGGPAIRISTTNGSIEIAGR